MPQKSQGTRNHGHDLATKNLHFLGGFAKYCCILPGTGTLNLLAYLSDGEATPLNCGVATIILAAEAAQIGIRDTAVMQGVGLLGLYGCAIAKARGAKCVIGLDAVTDRLTTTQ